MQTHTVVGEQLLRGVTFLRGKGLEVVRSHHERWDGKGYPDRRGGEEIPVAARVFAVADALDAMTSDRPYRPAMTWAAAGRELEHSRAPSSTRLSWKPSRPASGRCAGSGASSPRCRRSGPLGRERLGLGRRRRIGRRVWCQSTILPFTTRKIAVARCPGPSQRLLRRSPSSKVAVAVRPVVLIETIRPEQGREEFQATASAWVRSLSTCPG